MITEVKVVNTKVIKKLVDTDFYELRISVGNEYRAILFTIDHENIVQAEQILLLNGFMKKNRSSCQEVWRGLMVEVLFSYLNGGIEPEK